jgi:hypothetical protein
MVERVPYPQEAYRYCYFAHWIAHSLTYRMPTLLWLTQWSVWSSSENMHLYYKLRTAYGDSRLLHEAPGHLFLESEVEDLVSFLQVSMLNGWDSYLLTHADYVNAAFSHDQYIDFYAADVAHLNEVRTALLDVPKQ